MDIKKHLQEALIVALVLIAVATIFVTIVGYFDEGNPRIYGGFINYLLQGGLPPLSDYLVWGFIFTILGIPVFFAQNALPNPTQTFGKRLAVSAISIPLLLLGVLVMLMTIAA